jgi:hypothetical protein
MKKSRRLNDEAGEKNNIKIVIKIMRKKIKIKIKLKDIKKF